MKILLGFAIALVLTASTAGFQSTSNFAITLTFQGSTQTQADSRGDAAVLDYAKARSLPIYNADGTVNNSLVAPAVRADVKRILKDYVVAYRETAAADTAKAGIRQQVESELP